MNQNHGSDKWGCKGKCNQSDGKDIVHKTSLQLPWQVSACRMLRLDKLEHFNWII